MCDYSLHAVRTRDAKRDDVLKVSAFPLTVTLGFASPDDPDCAVCLKAGTEIAFDKPARKSFLFFGRSVKSRMATFIKVNEHSTFRHHDALRFDNGRIVLITDLKPGQLARVVQLPAEKSASQNAAEDFRRYPRSWGRVALIRC